MATEASMTYEQFLEALGKTPRTWFVSPIGTFSAIRRPDPRREGCFQCPMAAVFGYESDKQSYWRGVVKAADFSIPHSAAIRRDLLAACGLEERV